MESDTISRWTVSEFNRITGHPAGVGDLLGGLGKSPYTYTLDLGTESEMSLEEEEPET